jgi:hypothetical protein
VWPKIGQSGWCSYLYAPSSCHEFWCIEAFHDDNWRILLTIIYLSIIIESSEIPTKSSMKVAYEHTRTFTKLCLTLHARELRKSLHFDDKIWQICRSYLTILTTQGSGEVRGLTPPEKNDLESSSVLEKISMTFRSQKPTRLHLSSVGLFWIWQTDYPLRLHIIAYSQDIYSPDYLFP